MLASNQNFQNLINKVYLISSLFHVCILLLTLFPQWVDLRPLGTIHGSFPPWPGTGYWARRGVDSLQRCGLYLELQQPSAGTGTTPRDCSNSRHRLGGTEKNWPCRVIVFNYLSFIIFLLQINVKGYLKSIEKWYFDGIKIDVVTYNSY